VETRVVLNYQSRDGTFNGSVRSFYFIPNAMYNDVISELPAFNNLLQFFWNNKKYQLLRQTNTT